jgi:hypothetical protein
MANHNIALYYILYYYYINNLIPAAVSLMCMYAAARLLESRVRISLIAWNVGLLLLLVV